MSLPHEISEKRRQQNRESQRRYRKRQKLVSRNIAERHRPQDIHTSPEDDDTVWAEPEHSEALLRSDQSQSSGDLLDAFPYCDKGDAYSTDGHDIASYLFHDADMDQLYSSASNTASMGPTTQNHPTLSTDGYESPSRLSWEATANPTSLSLQQLQRRPQHPSDQNESAERPLVAAPDVTKRRVHNRTLSSPLQLELNMTNTLRPSSSGASSLATTPPRRRPRANSKAVEMIASVEKLYEFGVKTGILPNDINALIILRRMKTRFLSLAPVEADHNNGMDDMLEQWQG